MLTYRRQAAPTARPPALPTSSPTRTPSADIEVTGRWTGSIRSSKLSCGARYGYDPNDRTPVGWEYYAAGGVPGYAAVSFTWSEASRQPNVAITFVDQDGTRWEASSGGDLTGDEPTLFTISDDHRTVTFSAAGVATPLTTPADDDTIAQISTIAFRGTIACRTLHLR
ncbi:hypothetical protein [Gordonia malaquae]|uniref:hypothetical protein n=1 Tax=Gordonia malaquae TaxID=410332 RepID=UPI003019B3F5